MKFIDIERLFEICIAVSSEKELGNIFRLVLNAAMDMTGADGGTLYTLDEDKLIFNVMITRSKGFNKSHDKGEINIPPVPLKSRAHVCACCAMDKQLINIEDIYESKDYDFSGAKNYDALNEYQTRSMLVMPMVDEVDECIGVLQLINGDFDKDSEQMIRALSSFSAVSLHNKILTSEIRELLQNVVQMMIGAVEARSPYNANHTKSMVNYASRFIEWAYDKDCGCKVEPEDREPFLMSVWFHDVGKLCIPLKIMDKSSRLGNATEPVMHKISIGMLMEKIKYLSDGDKSHLNKMEELSSYKDKINEINVAGFLSDEKLEFVKSLYEKRVLDENENEIPILTDEEYEALSVRRGTLTESERKIIESHVNYTRSMLSELKFKGNYKMVPQIASAHHEFLNGSGYPDGKEKEDIPWMVRLLTIIDIYDALTAEDRPYKPAMPHEKAVSILESMVSEGKIDGNILSLFIESKAWDNKFWEKGAL